MDQTITTGFLEEVNEKTDPARLLEKIGYAVDKIQAVGDSVKAFCPLHRDTRFRALLIDGKKRTFKCTSKTCRGYGGGSLVELYALAGDTDPTTAALDIIGALDLTIEPAWYDRLAEGFLEEAEQACAAAEFASAERSALLALRFQPTLTRANMLLAEAYQEQGLKAEACEHYIAVIEAYLGAEQFAEADAAIERASGLFPASEDIIFLRIRSAELQHRENEVKDLLRRVAETREKAGRGVDNFGIYQQLVEAEPEDLDLRLKLSELFEARRDFKSANRELENVALKLMNLNRGAEAIPILEKVVQREPQLNKLRMMLVEELVKDGDFFRAKEHAFSVIDAQLGVGDLKGAAQSAQKWLEIEPESIEAHEAIARTFAEQDRLEEMAGELQIAAELALNHGEPDRALELLFRVKFARPEDVELRGTLISILQDQQQTARAAYELLELAEFHFARGNEEEAEHNIQTAADWNTDADFRLMLSRSIASHGREEAARQIQGSVADIAESEGQFSTAAEACRQMLISTPDDLPLAARYCRNLLMADVNDEAAEALEKYLPTILQTEDRKTGSELVRLAAAHPPADPDLSRYLFNAAIDLDLIEAAHSLYGFLAPQLKESAPDAALECANLLLSLKPEDVTALISVAECNLELGILTEAGEAFLRLAEIFRRNEDFHSALQYLDRAAEYLTDQPEIVRNRAVLLESLGDIEGAKTAQREYLHKLKAYIEPQQLVAEYETYLRLDPSDSAARRQFADLLAESGRTEDALREYSHLLGNLAPEEDNAVVVELRERMLAVDPENPRIQAGLARAYYRSGQHDAAVPLLLRAAQGYAQLGDMVEGASVAYDASLFYPNNTDVLENLVAIENLRENSVAEEETLVKLASVYERQGDFARALEKSERLAQLQPAAMIYVRRVAELRESLGDIDAAVAAWKNVASLLKNEDNQSQLLDVFIHITELRPGDVDALRGRAEIIEKTGSAGEREALYLLLVDAALESGEWKQAQIAIDKLEEINPQSEAIALALHKLAVSQGHSYGAVQTFLNSARVYAALGLQQQAVSELRDALVIDPENEEVHEMLASSLDELGNQREAFGHRLTLLRISLASAKTKVRNNRLLAAQQSATAAEQQFELARFLISAHLDKEAAETIEKAVSSARDEGDFACMLDACELSQELLRKNLALRRAKADALEQLGQTERLKGWLFDCARGAVNAAQLQDAEEFALRFLDHAPSDPDALILMASIYTGQQRTQRALDSSLAAGNALRTVGEYERAAQVIRDALEIDIENVPLRQLLWQVLLENEREEEAIGEMQHLSDILIERRSYKEAATLLSRILDYRTNSVSTLERLASLVYEHEGFAKALPYFRKLIALKKRTGGLQGATDEFERILRLEGASPEVRVEYAEFLKENDNLESAKAQFISIAQLYRDELNDAASAIEHFMNAAAILPGTADARIFEEIASLYTGNKTFNQQADALRKAARLYEQAEAYDKALSCLERVGEINITENRAPDYEQKGMLLLKTNDRIGAAEAFKSALRYSAAADTFTTLRKRTLCERLLDIEPLNFMGVEALIETLPEKEIPTYTLEFAARFGQADMQDEQMRVLKQGKALAPRNLLIRQELIVATRARGIPAKLRAELFELCRIAGAAKDMETAKHALDELAGMQPDPEQAAELAPLYAMCGDTDRALSSFCTAAELAVEQGRFDEAAQYLKNAFEVDRSAVPAPLVATLVRRSSGEQSIRRMASEILEGALLARSRTKALVIATALLETAADFEETHDLLQAIVSRSGAAFLVAIAGAHVDWLLERDKRKQAEAIIDYVTKAAPNSPDAWWLAAQSRRKLGDKEKAAQASVTAAQLYSEAGAVSEEESCYREALDEFPDDVAVLETLAFFYEREKRMSDAAEIFKRLSDLTLQSGDASAAASWLKRGLAVSPTELELHEILAELLITTGKPDEAIDQLVEVAQGYAKRNEPEKAQAFYERVLTVAPENVSALTYLLDAAAKSGDLVKQARLSLLLAEIHAESGSLAQACTVLKNLAKAQPENVKGLEKLSQYAERAKDNDGMRVAGLALARRFAADNRFMDAVSQLERLLENKPRDAELLEQLISYCRSEGMTERGAEFASRLLEYAQEAGDFDRIRRSAEIVLEYDPVRPEVRSDYAEALFCLNRVQEAVIEWTNSAEQFQHRKDFSGAVSALQRVTEVEPNNHSSWKKLAELLMSAGRGDEARAAYSHLYEAYLDSGEEQNAEAVIRRLLQLDPDDGMLHEKALSLYKRLGRRDSELSEFKWLLSHYLKAQDLTAAERISRESLEFDPENPLFQEKRFEILAKMGRTGELHAIQKEMVAKFLKDGKVDKAAEQLELIRDGEPDRVDIRKELAQLLIRLHRLPDAFKEYRESLVLLLRRKNSEEARELAESVLRDHPDDLELRATFAEVFSQNGMPDIGARYFASCSALADDPKEQIRFLRLALDARPRWPEGLRQLGDALIDSGDKEEAGRTYEKLEVILLEDKQLTEAISVLQKHISIAPKNPTPRRLLLEVYGRLGERDARTETLDQLAALYVSRGETDQAIEAYRELASMRPDDPVVLQRFVELFAQVGNELEIVDEYQRLAEALARKGDTTAATQTYEQILAIDRKNTEIREKFIAFLQSTGQKGRAVAEMRKLGDTYASQNRFQESIISYSNALAVHPKEAEICLALANAYKAAGNREAALSTYARAASILSGTSAMKGIDVYRRILQSDPDNTQVLKRYGEQLFRAGNNAEAATNIKRLAEIHSSRGELDLAEAAYKLASEYQPDDLNTLKEAINLHVYDPSLQYLDYVRYGDRLSEEGHIDAALDAYREARSLNDERAQLIQKCIDCLIQIAPEGEAVVDYLALAEKMQQQHDYTKARLIYEHVLQLDPANEDAKAGQARAFKAEMMASAGEEAKAEINNDERIKSASRQKNARVKVNELMQACDNITPPPDK